MKKATDTEPTETRDPVKAKADAAAANIEISADPVTGKPSTDLDPEAQPEDVALRFALDGSRVYAAVLDADGRDVTLDQARATPAEKTAENPMPMGEDYPTWRYHKSEPARLITSKEGEEAGWRDTPYASNPPATPEDGTNAPVKAPANKPVQTD